MNLLKHSLRIFIFLGFPMALCNSSLAQKALDVNLLTGSAQVSIPIGVLTSGDIVYPISFNYWGGGVKVDDYGQRFGLGWSFSAEAGVRREVRGFPDDLEISTGTGNPVYKGWIRTGNAANAVDNFTISNDNNPGTCSDEVTDYSYMNSNFPENLDTEPDIFTVDVPGLNFQFVFDKNQQIKTIPYRDVKIDYTVSTFGGVEEGQISSFTITNDKGIKYSFGQSYYVTFRYISENTDPSSLPAFRRNYKFYHNTNGQVYYRSTWYITSITDTKLNQLTYSYEMTEGEPHSFGDENIRLVNSQNQIQNLYVDKTYTSIPRIKKINVIQGGLVASEDGLDFAYRGNNPHASLHEMKFLRSGVIVWLDVRGPFNKTNDGEKAGRFFLESILVTAEHCSAITQKYKFTYYNVDLVNKTSYCTNVDSITNAQDYWGYYNGAITNPDLVPPIWVYAYNSGVSKYKITPIPNYQGTDQVYLSSGSDRSVNTNAVAGSLKRIIYPNGGVTEIEYDNNEYFDADVIGAVAGGGIRVKKVTNNDGLNTNEVTYYDYNDPLTNVTTGKAISIPDFTFAFPNSTSYSTTEDRVKNSTYRTLYDYSGERKQIIYGKVTVRKTNGGKSVYEFNTSGTRGSAATGDWEESFVNITRQITSVPNPCTAIAPDFFTNGKNIYPFPSNANFDFARGLLDKVSNYNESVGLISEQFYTYDYSHSSATKVAALKFDDVGNVRGYSKYNILTHQDKLIANLVTKTYNASNPNTSVYTSETQVFEYPTGTNPTTEYRLPQVIKKENSDGKTYVTTMQYAKDYSNTTGNGDDAEKAIHRLKEIGYNALIESYQSVQEGSVEKFISGSLSKFKKSAFGDFAMNVPLPNETYSFAEPNGTTSFSPSVISSNTFTFDSKYFKTGTVLKLNEDGNPGSVIGNSRIVSSVLYHFPLGLKVAEFSNAKQEEILYAPFDYISFPGMMLYSGGTIVKPGRYSTSCFSFNTGGNISGTIEKAATNKNIVFSCWVKDAPGSGSLTITLTASGFSANYSVPFTAHSNWKYYEIKMPRPSPQSITVTVTTSDALKIDDILVYPDNASVKTNSYTKLTVIRKGVEVSNGIVLTAETGMNGTTRYYQYANTAMPHLIKDVDENIVQINEPRQINQTAGFYILTMTLPPIVQVNIPADFDVFVGAPCDAVITYTWDFGDGSLPTVTTTKTATHTYTTAGSYTLSCTISATGYTSYTYSPIDPIVVHGGPIPYLCASGVIGYSGGTGCELGICAGGHQPTCTETKFIVSSMTGGSITEITNWHWQKAPAGTSNWTTVSNGAVGVIIVPFSTTTPVTQSYKIKCTVTLGNGLTGVSAEYTIYSN